MLFIVNKPADAAGDKIATWGKKINNVSMKSLLLFCINWSLIIISEEANKKGTKWSYYFSVLIFSAKAKTPVYS